MAPTLKPEPGDLIEISRGMYHHWAIYVGNCLVVHLSPPSEVPGASASSKSVLAEKAIVKEEKLCDVVGTDSWKINNSLNKKYTPRSARVIVREARALVGKELPYSITMKNCEHFVNELRYEKAESQQVLDVKEVVKDIGVGVGITIGLTAIGYVVWRLLSPESSAVGGSKKKS